MSDRIEALKSLLAKVRSGDEIIAKDVWDALSEGEGVHFASVNFAFACKGSLDSAETFHNAFAPDYRWWVAHRLYWAQENREVPCVTLVTGTPGIDLKVFSAFNDIPARAWVDAVLQIMIAELSE